MGLGLPKLADSAPMPRSSWTRLLERGGPGVSFLTRFGVVRGQKRSVVAVLQAFRVRGHPAEAAVGSTSAKQRLGRLPSAEVAEARYYAEDVILNEIGGQT